MVHDMAQIIQTTFIVTISKLVKDDQSESTVLDKEQTQIIQQMLPGVVEEVLADSAVIVEVHPTLD